MIKVDYLSIVVLVLLIKGVLKGLKIALTGVKKLCTKIGGLTMTVETACRDIKELAVISQKACNLFLDECKKQGVDVFITETYRSQERQNYLYAQGRTRTGQVVTWTLSSNHTGRMAWDIACTPKTGIALYDVTTLCKAGEIAKRLGITWGGTWSSPDRPHFEIKSNWKAPEQEVEEVENNTVKEIPQWQNDGLQKLVSDGIIGDEAYWTSRMGQNITVGEVVGLLGKMAATK